MPIYDAMFLFWLAFQAFLIGGAWLAWRHRGRLATMEAQLKGLATDIERLSRLIELRGGATGAAPSPGQAPAPSPVAPSAPSPLVGKGRDGEERVHESPQPEFAPPPGHPANGSSAQGAGEKREAADVWPAASVPPTGTAAPPPLPPGSVPATPPAARPGGANETIEDLIGGKLIVWGGGVTLALGAVFLVRYSIEHGLLGPGARLILGGLVSTALAAAGEYVRRLDLKRPLGGVPSAYIPGALTAAAIVGGFATVYAAYGLYDFLNPLVAFALMAVVSLAGLAASSLHGPGLAALGLLGSYVSPALVSTGRPNAWALFPYLLLVTTAAYWTADLRRWLWLAQAAATAAVLWVFLWLLTSWGARDAVPIALYVAGLTLLAVWFLRDEAQAARAAAGPTERMERDGPALELGLTTFDWPLIAVLAGTTLIAGALVRWDAYGAVSLALLAGTVALLLAVAWMWPSLVPLAPWAALLFGFAYVTWHLPALGTVWQTDVDNKLATVPAWAPPHLATFLTVGALFATGIAATGYAALLARRPHPFWTAIAALTPLLTLVHACWRATNFEHSVRFGLVALALAGAYAWLTEHLNRSRRGHVIDWSVGALAGAAVAALALASTMMLEKGWLTIALSLMAPGLAWISTVRPIGILRPIAAGLAAVVAVRLVLDPRIVGTDLGSMPILNWLLYGYGLPALAFAAAARILRQRRDDVAVQVLEGAAIAFLVALISLEVRHLMNGGNVFAGRMTLAELALHTLSWLGLSIGLHWRHAGSGRLVTGYAARIVGIAGMLAMLFGHLFARNPALTEQAIAGGPVLNDLLLAYAAPAVLAGLLYWRTREEPPPAYATVAGIAALAMAFAYVSLEVGRLFQGPVIRLGLVGDTELYAYSMAWIGFAVALLAAGIRFGTPALRHAGFAVLLLAVLKVFLLDMAGLKGLLRALSFLGLGLALMGIGYAYQRLVLPARPRPAAAAPAGPDQSR